VTGRVTDGEKDGAILDPGPLEGSGVPLVPVNGVFRMLEQVGGSGGGEKVWHYFAKLAAIFVVRNVRLPRKRE
jgi:hypothetical protein